MISQKEFDRRQRQRETSEAALTVSVTEAARQLGLSRDAAYRAVHRGEIPAIKLGALYRVPKVQIERLLNGGK